MRGAHGFQLVRAIRRVESSRRIKATTAWTGAGGLRPACFFLEAMSQAAGWLIAASTDFIRRGLPVAIGAFRFLAAPPAGSRVDLEAEIMAWRDTSAVVRGQASTGGRVLGEAEGICGLSPADQFEDPAATKATYAALLEGTAVPPDAAHAVEPPGAPRIDALDARAGRATWLVAGGNGLFADHFPRFPVLPGSLQVQALADLAREVAEAGNGRGGSLIEVQNVRFRRPVRPGERLSLEVEAAERAPTRAILTARAQVDGQRAASIGKIHIGLVR